MAKSCSAAWRAARNDQNRHTEYGTSAVSHRIAYVYMLLRANVRGSASRSAN